MKLFAEIGGLWLFKGGTRFRFDKCVCELCICLPKYEVQGCLRGSTRFRFDKCVCVL
jgi:hypothetical protein